MKKFNITKQKNGERNEVTISYAIGIDYAEACAEFATYMVDYLGSKSNALTMDELTEIEKDALSGSFYYDTYSYALNENSEEI